jgi:hypothetical protein
VNPHRIPNARKAPTCRYCTRPIVFKRTVLSDGQKYIALDPEPQPGAPIALDARDWAYTPGLPEEGRIPEEFLIDDDERYRAHNDSCPERPSGTRQGRDWMDR